MYRVCVPQYMALVHVPVHTRVRLCVHVCRQKLAVRMQSDTSLLPVIALDLLASGRRKLFT